MNFNESCVHRVVVIGGATAIVMIALLFAKSPTMDTNPQFLFGCGDGSNGYYAERPEPLELVQYKRMP